MLLGICPCLFCFGIALHLRFALFLGSLTLLFSSHSLLLCVLHGSVCLLCLLCRCMGSLGSCRGCANGCVGTLLDVAHLGLHTLQGLLGVGNCLFSILYQVAQLHRGSKHHKGCVHLHAVLALLRLEHRVTGSVVVNNLKLLILVRPPIVPEQLALHLKSIRPDGNLVALHTRKQHVVLAHINGVAQGDASVLVHDVHLDVRTPGQRKRHLRAVNNLHDRHTQLKIVAPNYPFHKLITKK